ncbi:glycosyltransferase family 4 protein [Dissulfurispira sp.]|uniref:glycosyltransferase family 4 protein n=1 Tax=Dissulfurispira sp. TaxID=2817609 RepID=UPI002FDA12C7
MKIGIIATDIWNSVFLEMAESLADLGQRVVVFTDDRRSPGTKNFLHIHENGVEFFVINDKKRHPYVAALDKLFKKILRERRFFTMLVSIYRFIKRNRDCDVFIVEWDWTGFFVAIINLFLPFRWIVGVHDLNNLKISIEYPGRENRSWVHHARQWVYRRADLIRANSYVTRDFLIESGCPAEKIEVIPLYTTKWMRLDENENLENFRQHCRAEIFAKHHFDEETKLLVTMCKIAPVKGLDLAIRSMPYVLQQQKNIILMICGGDRIVPGIGSYREYLETLSKKLGVDKHVIFAGHIQPAEVKKYLSAGDIHLAPSVIDTFNYAIIEAALVGTFSIVSSTAGSAYWMMQEKAGEIISDRDPIAWGHSILKHLHHPEQNELIESRRRLAQRLHPKKVAEETLAMINKYFG